MQIGAENRKQMIVLLVLAVVAAIAVPSLFSGKSATKATSASSATGSTTKTKLPNSNTANRNIWRGPGGKPQVTASLDPSLRFDLLKHSEDQEYQGGKRNIFEDHQVEIPTPIDPGINKNQTPLPPQPPPGPPPIPLKFYGFSSQPGQAKRIFLSDGDDVFVGVEGQVINRRYRIVKVNNANVEIEDIINNNKQTIPLSPPS